MASFDRKVKRTQAKKAKKLKQDKWEDLIPLCRECQVSYFSLFSKLVELEKQFKEVISKDVKLQQAVSGLAKTYKELGERIALITDRHTYETDQIGEDGKPIKDFLRGVIPMEDPKIMDFEGISAAYQDVLIYIATTAMNLFTALLSDIQVFSNAITEDDVNMIKKAVDKGQDKIMDTISKGAQDAASAFNGQQQ